MGRLLGLLLTVATSAGMALLGHRFGLAHFHLIGGIPLGAVAIGGGAAIGASVAIRLTKSYDTAGMRILAQLGGLGAYAGAVVLDYLALKLRVGPKAFAAPELLSLVRYLQLLVTSGAAAFVGQMPQWVKVPMQVGFWIGSMRLLVEIIGTIVATGWMVSLLTDVPFCWKNRRFYDLRYLVESANAAAVREWEIAMDQRRPVEARAILARVKAGRVRREDKTWMRIAVHQCPGCHASRVRIERRRRALGRVRTEPADELNLDAARGAVLLAT